MSMKLKVATAAAMLSALTTGAQACMVNGTSGDDTLSSSVPCRIAGFDGNDTITGSTGDDLIYPGANSSTHAGTDVMTGNGGSDIFVFEPTGSIGMKADQITDFGHADDIVNVYPVCHAVPVTCFFSSGGFTGSAGQTIYTLSGGGTLGTISIDLDGDSVADYQIKLTNAPVFNSNDIDFTPPPPRRHAVKTGSTQ